MDTKALQENTGLIAEALLRFLYDLPDVEPSNDVALFLDDAVN